MYILVVRRDKQVIYQKEFKTFEDLMKKFNEIDFAKEKCSYNIYKNMNITEILHEFLKNDDEIDKIKNELKDIINEL